MKSFEKVLSLCLALIMLLSVMSVAPISAFAAEDDKKVTAIDEDDTNVEDEYSDEDETYDDEDETYDDEDESLPDDEDETVPDDVEETLPEGDMAKPVSLEVENIHIYEDLDSAAVTSYDEDYNEVKWVWYSYSDLITNFTVTLEDGTKLVPDEDGHIVYNGVEFDVDCYDDQAYDNTWGVGEHVVNYKILGLEA
ncbi:MAG: hypothetical protein IJ725_06435, partial [Ruminococcus sp.]|nr:hypothetical protein [Ruminococcus sp.]